MTAPRFFCPPDQGSSLEGREAHHALHVLRLREGDAVILLDGRGGLRQARIARTHRHEVVCEVVSAQHRPPPSPHLTLLQGILKPRAMEWLLQKATELGVARLVPLLTEHGVVKTNPDRHKQEKWHWIAVDALKQSGHAWLPEIGAPVELPEPLARQERFPVDLLASLHARHSLRDVLSNLKSTCPDAFDRAALWIGPEGDFSPAEQDAICAAGSRPVSFGPTVLRAETAALYGLSVLRHELSR